MVLKEAIYHVPKDQYCYPLDDQTMSVTIRVKKGDFIGGKVFFTDRYRHENYHPPIEHINLHHVGSDNLYDYWRGKFKLAVRRPRYVFLLETKIRDYWFSENGLTVDRPKENWFEFPFIVRADLPDYPKWLKTAVFYQIAVDRFYNGNSNNDQQNVRSWGEEPTMTTFFGGDLEGVIQKIDYLVNLGVNAIYFNPLFMSPSTFKYDTEDYYQIDPHFGGNEAFDQLIQVCHEHGIKVILDAVFNHVGLRFQPFIDVCERGKESPYYEWFEIHDWPIKMEEPFQNYETFAYTARMPKLRHDHPEVREYLLKVTEYWTRKGIDGWRLDVANEIDHAFWREFRKLVRSINKDTFILGEVWLDGTTWLQGDQFDSITNYLFRSAVLDYFGYQKIGVTTFDERLLDSRIRYREDTNQIMFNLIGSHDVPRFLGLCNDSEDRILLATVFLFTYPGIPMIYYGDEIGMNGGNDFVQSRKCMVWEEEKQNIRLFDLYKTCISWRKSLKPLTDGDYQRIYISEAQNIYGFARNTDDEAVWVFFHNDLGMESIEIPVSSDYSLKDLKTGQKITPNNGLLNLKFENFSCYVFHVTKK